jgi:hypothetical protein
MTKQFEIGKQYRLVDINKAARQPTILIFIDGMLTLPSNNIFVCTGRMDDVGMCLSTTEGVLWKGKDIPSGFESEWRENGGWAVAFDEDLEAGAFELVE